MSAEFQAIYSCACRAMEFNLQCYKYYSTTTFAALSLCNWASAGGYTASCAAMSYPDIGAVVSIAFVVCLDSPGNNQ